MRIAGGKGTGEPRTFEGFGMKVPLPTWGPAVLVFVIVAGAAVYGVFYGLDHLRHDDQNAVRVKASELVQLNESAKHFGEPPESSLTVYRDARGGLDVQLFPSDGCLLVRRSSPDPRAPVINLFIQDPRQLHDTVPPKFAAEPLFSLEPAAWAGEPSTCAQLFATQQHPGTFRWEYGQRSDDGCWVQVWRHFEDGCVHWQPFNSCNNTWGGITWTACKH